MLRKILDSQNDIRKQVDKKANTSKIKLNDNYYLVENSNQLQKVLNETLLNKALASTQEVNQIFKKIIKSYSSIIDLNEEYN